MKTIIAQYINKHMSYSKAIECLTKDHPNLVSQLLIDFKTTDTKLAISCLMSGKDSTICPNRNFYKAKNLKETRFCARNCICANKSGAEKRKSLNEKLTKDDKLRTQKKKENTFLKRYGTTNPAKSKEIQNKIKKTNMQKYGSESHLSNKDIREKIKKTTFEKYGVDNVLSKGSPIKQKVKQTLIERYSVDNPAKIKGMTEKKKKKSIEENGYSHNHQKSWSKETLDILLDEQKFKSYVKGKSVHEVSDKLSVSPLTIYFRFKQYDCYDIISNDNKSYYEKVVSNWVSTYSTTIINNSRNIISPKELDIYLPDKKIAIEINGNYWHSEFRGNKNRNYHLEKTSLAEKQGIDLIHLLTSEWDNKQSIVKSIIRNKLGSVDTRYYARKTKIKEIDTQVAKRFLEDNHLQGYCNSSIKLGLYHQDTLVACITFGKLRKALGNANTSNEHYEIYRYAVLKNTSVIGGFSKLLKYFEVTNRPKLIVTYADRRFFTGTMYELAGFDFVKNTSPNYWYFNNKDPNKLYHRYKFRKSVLLQEGYSADRTEWDIMKSKGFDRIWDCGHRKFQKVYK